MYIPLVQREYPPQGHIAITEVMPQPSAGEVAWVEIYNFGPRARSLAGSVISDLDGGLYHFPDALPPVPPGAYIVLRFDGLGPAADDTDLSDGLAILHAEQGLTAIFDPAGDQCALFESSSLSSDSIMDFVAWGQDPVRMTTWPS